MRPWIPALGRWRSPDLYERLLRLSPLADLAEVVCDGLELPAGARVLDLGCGPGRLTRLILDASPQARAVGLDPDRGMLAKAAARSPEARTDWVEGLAQRLPFADASFDRVAAVLFLHHLTRDQKLNALAEVRRVLRPGGQLVVGDWTRPRGLAAAGFLVVRLTDGFAPTADHAAGRLEALIEQAGFRRLERLHERTIALGSVVVLRCERTPD